MEQVEKKVESGVTYYPFTTSQETIAIQEKYSLHKGMMQIPVALYFNRAIDGALLTKAMNIEFERNDSLRVVFVKEKKNSYQYYLEKNEFKNLIEADFTGKTEKEQNDFITKTARVPLKYYNNEPVKLALIKSFDGKTILLLVCNHLNIDAWGAFIMISDLFSIYNSLETGAPMPAPLASSEACLKEELNYTPEMREADKKALTEFFTKDGKIDYAHIINFDRELSPAARKRALNKTANRKLASLASLFHDKTECLELKIAPEMVKAMVALCEAEKISFSNFIYFGLRTYLQKINNSDDIMYMSLCNRRGTLAEKRSGGCRVSSSYLRTIVSKDVTFKDAIAIIDGVQRKQYRHLRYGAFQTAQILNDLYEACQFVEGGSLMFTLLPLNLPMPEGFNCDIKWVSLGSAASTLYLFAIPESDGSLLFDYEYRTYVTNADQMHAMHEAIIKIFDACIKNPDILVGDILKQI